MLFTTLWTKLNVNSMHCKLIPRQKPHTKLKEKASGTRSIYLLPSIFPDFNIVFFTAQIRQLILTSMGWKLALTGKRHLPAKILEKIRIKIRPLSFTCFILLGYSTLTNFEQDYFPKRGEMVMWCVGDGKCRLHSDDSYFDFMTNVVPSFLLSLAKLMSLGSWKMGNGPFHSLRFRRSTDEAAHWMVLLAHWFRGLVPEMSACDVIKKGKKAGPEVLALKHESRILRQWSNPVSGSRKTQASCPWAKQHRETICRIGWMSENPTLML